MKKKLNIIENSCRRFRKIDSSYLGVNHIGLPLYVPREVRIFQQSNKETRNDFFSEEYVINDKLTEMTKIKIW